MLVMEDKGKIWMPENIPDFPNKERNAFSVNQTSNSIAWFGLSKF